ncbi:hypothetical protein GQ600_22766 [Phytophthora cactorum]|nr:hypothetical protein GQ600_22766 [Phytophthora cactorum]
MAGEIPSSPQRGEKSIASAPSPLPVNRNSLSSSSLPSLTPHDAPMYSYNHLSPTFFEQYCRVSLDTLVIADEEARLHRKGGALWGNPNHISSGINSAPARITFCLIQFTRVVDECEQVLESLSLTLSQLQKWINDVVAGRRGNLTDEYLDDLLSTLQTVLLIFKTLANSFNVALGLRIISDRCCRTV